MTLGRRRQPARGTRRRPSRRVGAGARLGLGIGAMLLATTLASVANAETDLGTYLKTRCDFDTNPWCQLPGDPKASYISRAEALEISRGDEAARKRLWGWGGPKETFGAWGSAATDGKRMYFFGGGHHHYRGNGIKVYDFETLSWSRLYDPAYVTTETHPAGDRRYVPEHGPRATHVYDGMVYAPEQNSLYLWGHNNFHAWRFDLDIWERTRDPWQAWSKFPIPEGTRGSAPDFFRTALLDNGDILVHGSSYARGRGEIFVFDPESQRYRRNLRNLFHATALTAANGRAYGKAAEHDRINVYNRDGRRIDTIDKPPFGTRGIAHHPGRDLLVFWEGGADTLVYDLTADRWQQVGTLAEDVPTGARNGPFGRWRYLPEHDVFVGLASAGQAGQRMWAYRLADPLPDRHPLKEKRRDAGYMCSDEIAGWECPDLQKQVDAGSVKKGVYHQCAKVRGEVDFNDAWLKNSVCGKKASLITFDGAEIANVKITDVTIGANANCVRWQGGTLTIRNMTCRNADMGLLGFGERLVITDSTFERTLDRGSNHGHIIYACPRDAKASELVLRDTTVRAPGDDGHVLKTGCATTRVEGSVLDGGDGNYSRVIDAFNGGHLIVQDSTIAAGQTGGNGDLIGFGAEQRTPLSRHHIEVRGGTVDCRNLPIWGHALHTWPDRVRPGSVSWQPSRNLKCNAG